MKKNFLLFLFMLIDLAVHADVVDVTDHYLINAGFDTSSSWQTSNVATSGSANSFAIDGWTLASSAAWSSSASFGYGGGGQINGADVPVYGADGSTTGGALGISTGWGGVCKYSQAVTLPAGKYKISYAAYNNLSGVFQSYNYIGFESTAKNTYGTIHNFLYQTWMKDSVYLNLTEETTGNIVVGLGGVSGGSGANAKVFIDYVKIEAYNAAVSTMPGSTVTAGSWSGNTGTYQSTYPEYYSTSHFTGDAMTNTTTVDNGNYDIDMAFHSHMAWIGQVATDGTQNSYITVEDYTLPVGIVNNTGFAAYEPTTYHLENVEVTDGSLDIKVGNSAQGGNWLTVGTPTITQMTTPYVSYGAFTLPDGNTTAGYWYVYDVPITGKYKITSSVATTLTYTQTATDLITAGTSVSLSANTASDAISLTQGKLYLKSSAAATISIEASTYSYQVGEATADITYVQGGETVTVTYATAGSNDPDVSLSVNTSGVTFGGSAVTCTATATGFAFVAPATTAGQSYTLSIPAGAVAYTGHVSNAAQTITMQAPAVFDGTYYLANEDGEFLSRGSSWGTRAIADDWGQPVEITTAGDGYSIIKFLDSNLYLYNGDTNIWTDGTDPTNTNTKWTFTLYDGKYRLASAQQSGKYVKMDDGDANLYSNGSDDALIQNWTLEAPADHPSKMDALRTSMTALSNEVSGLSSKTYVSATTSKTGEEYEGTTCAGANTSIVSGSLAVYPGIYKFSIPAFHRIATNPVGLPRHNAGTESVPVYAYFGDAKVQLHSVYDATTTSTSGCYTTDSVSFYPNTQGTALTAFKADSYVNTIWVRVTEATTLTYGIQNQGRPGTGGRWTCYASDGIEITRYYDPTTEALNDGDDITSLLKNPTIESTDAGAVPNSWSGNTSSWRWTQGTGDNVMECWNSSASAVSFNMYQTLTGLQEGVYELSAEMFNSSNDSTLMEAFTGGECGLYATTTGANAYVGVTTDGTTLTNHTLYIYVTDNGTLTIGVKNVATPTARWFACDNFTLKYRTLESAKADLIASIPTDKANIDLKNVMNSASITLQNTTSGDNFNALTTAIANVRVSAANYGHYNYALNHEDSRLSAVGDTVQTEYSSLMNSYKTAYTNQTASADCNTEIQTVKAALAQALVNQKACMTPLINNNSFETGDQTGWAMTTYGDDTGVKINGGTTYGTDGGDGTYLFNTWAASDLGGYPLKQNIGWMPAGTYKLTGLVTSSTGTIFLLANDYTSTGTTPTDKTTFLNASLTFTLTDLTEVTIGVAGGNSSGLYDGGSGSWYKADNFQLNASTAKSGDDEEEEEVVDGISFTTNPYFARGSENIFGRFSISGNSTTPTEQGLCYSAYKQKPTTADSTTTDNLSYCGKIFKISNLQASTFYYVRPYVIISGKTYYGAPHKVYTIAKGSITYGIRSSDNSTYDTNITNAVSTMVDYWNRYTNISGYYVNAGYVSGVATADCSYGGYIRFGANTSYQQCGTAMHESLHGIGVGTGGQWSTLCSGKTWTGPRVNEFIKFFENSDAAKVYGDSQHAWCTSSNGGLSYTINGANEDAYSDLQRTANSLLAQAFGEDGLKPTSSSYYFVPYYSIEQEETDVFYIQNGNNGKYLVDGKGTLGVQAYASLEDAKAAGNAGWRFTFNPSTQWYTITSVKYGNKLSHENYSWGLNKSDSNIAIVESVNSNKYWLNTPTTDGRNLLGDLSCGTTAIVDTNDVNGQDWIITRVRKLKGDVDKNGLVDVADVKAIVNILLGYDSSAYDTDAADVNENGEITISDMNALIDILKE